MPPRSVCLNVFTSSLGNGKEKEGVISVREVERDVPRKKDDIVEERTRHDSVQDSINDSIATPQLYAESFATTAETSPVATSDIDISLPADIGRCFSNVHTHPDPTGTNSILSNIVTNNVPPLTCDTCARTPTTGISLLRCSRCKRAYYCSKICQRVAWKTHRNSCESATTTAPSPASTLHTPDLSTTASPTNVSTPTIWNGQEFLPAKDNLLDSSLKPYTRRYPQSTDDWRKHNPFGSKYTISFGTNTEDLHKHLAASFRLWVTSHGGKAPTREEGLDEFRDYLNAIKERVHFPFLPDDMTNIFTIQNITDPLLLDIESATTRIAAVTLFGEDITTEFEKVNEEVYGVLVTESCDV